MRWSSSFGLGAIPPLIGAEMGADLLCISDAGVELSVRFSFVASRD